MPRSLQKATRAQTRVHNSRLVLKAIYDHGQISRADIARLTGLTPTTVSKVVAGLLEQGLVEEVGYSPSIGGKPAILLSVVDDSRHLLGIDLASDEFRGAVVNLRGQICRRIARPLHGQDGDKALALVYDLIDDLSATGGPLLGIGIGTPGLIDPVSGMVRSAVNLDWQDLPLRSMLHGRYGLPVYVANDCQAAALAEHTFGDGKDAESLVVVKVDQGVGAGIVLHGRLFYGDLCSAGEIGHIAVVEDGQRCRCGNLGCLETVAGERAIIQQAQAIAQADPHSSLHRFAAAPDQITIETICRAAEAGDPAVRQLIADAGRYLGFAVANLVGVLGVRRIMIAGHVTCFGQPWLDAIRRELSRRSLATVTGEVVVEISGIGRDIVILGASAMVLINELGLLAPVVDGMNV